ncbi:hypothetical protein [Actinomadura hibisca]|uniref:hypothetical protein n=1 Tax=Actinomadura hibisca TaxID=68565 RepID=UPI0009FE96CF|nr:hypothetical protein [Actinomadura hibisca]
MTELSTRPADTTATPSAERGVPTRDRSRAFARRHRVFLAVAALGVVLRIVTMLGYRSVLWFPDSYDYLSGAVNPNPNLIRPSGYSLFLALAGPFQSLTLVAFLQHAMGVGMAVMLYALLYRRGLKPWMAGLAAAPLLLDAYQLQLEHLVMSDTLFAFLVMASVTALLGPQRHRARWAVAGALLMGLAAITRSTGLPLLALVIVVLLVRRAGWRTVTAAVAAAVIPLVAYASWFATDHGQFTLTRSTGVFLYGRVAPFADCHKMDVPVEEMALCLGSSPAERSVRQSYIWGMNAPRHRVEAEGFTPEGERVARSFAVRAIISQPLDYLAVAGTDIARAFRLGHPPFPDADTYRLYLFAPKVARPDAKAEQYIRAYDPGYEPPRVVEPYAGFLGAYQKAVYLPGLALLVIAVLGAVRIVRRRADLGGDNLLPWCAGMGLIVIPAFTAQFDYRYVLPAAPLLMLAAGLNRRA